MIGPIRGNSWRLLISLSLRLRVPGSVLRQLSANRDMDLFLGAAKVPYVFCDLDRYRSRRSPIRVFARYRFFRRIGRQEEEFVVWKYRAAFRRKRKMREEKVKKAEMKKNTRTEELLIEELPKMLHVSQMFLISTVIIHIYMFNWKGGRLKKVLYTLHAAPEKFGRLER